MDEAAAAGKAVSIQVEKFNPAMRLYRRPGFKTKEGQKRLQPGALNRAKLRMCDRINCLRDAEVLRSNKLQREPLASAGRNHFVLGTCGAGRHGCRVRSASHELQRHSAVRSL